MGGNGEVRIETLDALFHRLAERGQGAYGLSAVSQLEHALQSAALAESRHLGAALIVAALFHDVGHLRTASDEAFAARGVDDRHEQVGAAILARMFEPQVTDPVRLHVTAKRYLCTVEGDYFERLSPDSVRSLELQGGRMNPGERAAFEAEPHHLAALALRRIDDDAKVPGLRVPALEHYRPMAERVLGGSA
jgi:[1-hydroxy-2-(trimethylamino)ethyl]phosphonate dioxygenase